MRDHTKLRACELADEVLLPVYRATVGFPKEGGNLRGPLVDPGEAGMTWCKSKLPCFIGFI